MNLEGRYSIFSSKLLRFLKCDDLNFVWHEDDVPFPIDVAALHSRTIEVYGRFALQGDKPVFRVERVNELPSDEETFRVRRIALADSPAPAWYALGEWALDRATFYGDLGLEAEARSLDAEGIVRELATLSDSDLDAKIALSRKFTKYGLREQDRLDFLFDAFLRRWLQLKPSKAPPPPTWIGFPTGWPRSCTAAARRTQHSRPSWQSAIAASRRPFTGN